MAESGLVFEIMNQFHYWWPQLAVPALTARYVEIVTLFAEAGVRFCMGSDAHRTGGIGNLAWSHRVAREAGLTAADLYLPPLLVEAGHGVTDEGEA